MSVQSEIDRIKQNVKNTYSSLESVGADVPENQNSNNLPETVLTIKAVRYDQQTLTEEQKAQARANIDATGVYIGSGEMPDGYTMQIDPDGDADDLVTRAEFEQLSEQKVNKNGDTLGEGSEFVLKGHGQLSALEVDDMGTRMVSQNGQSFVDVTDKKVTIKGLGDPTSDTMPVTKKYFETKVETKFEDEKSNIVQEILTQLQGLPVFGVVDENNIITVTSQLTSGIYTLMYEDSYGTLTEVGTITVGSGEVVIVNLLESAVGTLGTVLNDVGYVDGYYLSGTVSVDGNNSYMNTDSACFVTGFMPYTKEQLIAKTPIYIKGVALDKTLSYVRLGLYPSYDYTEYSDPLRLSTSYLSVTELGTNYYSITPVNTDGILEAYPNYEDIAYFRLSLNGVGDGVIITVGQEIPD